MKQAKKITWARSIVIAIVLILLALTACMSKRATENEISQDHIAVTGIEENAGDTTSSIQQESDQSPFVLEAVDETENGFVLRGIFLDSAVLPDNAALYVFLQSKDWWKITDADGQIIDFSSPGPYSWGIHDPSYFPWAIELKNKQYNWPLTIAIDAVAYTLPVIGRFNFDTGLNPQEGQTWDLNLAVEVGEIPVRINTISRTENGYLIDAAGDFEMINIISLSNEPIDVEFEDLDNDHKQFRLVYDGEVPAGVLTFELSSPVFKLHGPWQMKWQPDSGNSSITMLPEDEESINIPTINASQTCLTADTLEGALMRPSKIPVDLSGKVFMTASDRTLIEDEPVFHAFVANLDGSERHGIGYGVYRVSPSPDGSQIVYERSEGPTPGDGLYIENILTGEVHSIPNTIAGDSNPLWSPDGTRIAFVRFGSVSDSTLYTIKPDGTDIQKATDEAGLEFLQDWFPDSLALLFVKQIPIVADDVHGSFSVRKVDINSGLVTDLFPAQPSPQMAISPSGNKIAFGDSRSADYYDFYVFNLDDSKRTSIAMLSDWSVLDPVWSPDGNWLLLNLFKPGVSKDELMPVLVNINTCQIVPLPFQGRIILSWTE